MKKKKTLCLNGFVITGINRLTGLREIISQEMTYDKACKIIDRERGKTRRAWLYLKAEYKSKSPRQLTIQFEEI